MSVNLSANEDLDLNSDAASVEEVTRVSVTESVGTRVSGSVVETLVERGSDEVRVSGGGDDVVVQLEKAERIDGEGNSNVVAGDEVRVSSGGDDVVVQLEAERIDGEGDSNVVAGDEVRVSGREDVNMESSVVEEVHEVVEERREVVEMAKEEKSMEGGCSGLEKNRNLEDEGVCGSRESVRNEDLSNEETLTVQDVDQGAVGEVAGMVSNEMDGDQRVAPNAADENLNDGSQATVDCVALDGSDKLDSGRVTESTRSLENQNVDTDGHGAICHASEDKEQKAQLKAVRVGDSWLMTEVPMEQIQGVVEEEVARQNALVTNAVASSDAQGGSSESLLHHISPEGGIIMQGMEPEKITPLAEATSNRVELEVHQDEAQIENKALKMGSSISIDETMEEQIQGGVEGKIARVDVEEQPKPRCEISGTNAVNSADVLRGSAEYLQHNVSPKEDTSMQIVDQVEVVPAAETTSNHVELEVRHDEEQAEIKDSNVSSTSITEMPAEHFQGVIGGAVVPMDGGEGYRATYEVSQTVAVNSSDILSGSPKSLQTRDSSLEETTSSQVELEVQGTTCHASKDKERAEIEVVKTGSSTLNVETMADQIQGVVGGDIAPEVLEINAMDADDGLGGSPKVLQLQDISTHEDTSMQDVEPEKVSTAAERTSNQVKLEVHGPTCLTSSDKGRAATEGVNVGSSISVTETNAVDLVHTPGGSAESLQNQDISPEDSLMQDREPEKVAPVVETTSNVVELEVHDLTCCTSEVKEQAAKVGSTTFITETVTESRGVIGGEVGVVDVLEAGPKSLQHADVSPVEVTSMQATASEEVPLAAETISNQAQQHVSTTTFHPPEDGGRSEVELVKVGSSISVTNAHTGVVLKTDEISEINTMDLNQADGGGGSPESLPHEDICPEKDTSIQDMVPEKVASTAETTSYQVESRVLTTDCHASEDEEQKAETEVEGSQVSSTKLLVEQVQVVVGGKVAVVDNDEVPEAKDETLKINAADPSQVDTHGGNLGSLTHEDICPKEHTSLQNMGPEKISTLLETTSDQVEPEVPATECRASEYEEQITVIEPVKEESSTLITKMSVEKSQAVAGEELVLMDSEVSKNRDEVPEIDVVDCNQADTLDGSRESFSHEDLHTQNHSMQEPEKISPVTETTSDQVDDEGRMESRPIPGNSNEKASIIVSKSLAEVTDGDGSQYLGSCSSLHGEDESDSVLVTKSVQPVVQFTVVHDSEVEEQKPAGEDVHVGCSSVILESMVEKTEGVVGDGVLQLDKEEVSEMNSEISEINATNVKATFMEKNQSLQTEVLGGSIRLLPNEEYHSCKEDTFMQDVKQDTVDSAEINESVGPSENGNADSKIQGAEGHVAGDEQVNSQIEVPIARSATMVSELLPEQTQVVAGKVVTPVHNEEFPEMVKEVLGADALDVKSSMKTTQVLGPEVACPGSESLPNEDLAHKVLTSVEDEKQAMVAQVTETVFSQVDGDERMDTLPIEENLDETIVNSNSVGEAVDGSQATFAGASIYGDSKPDSTQVTEFFGPLADANLDPEVQVAEDRNSPLDNHNNMGIFALEASTSAGEMNQNVEISETGPAAGPSQLVKNQAEGPNGSEVGASVKSSNVRIMGSVDENSNKCPSTDGNRYPRDGVAMQGTSPPNESYEDVAETKDMGNEVGFSGFDHLDDNAAEEEGEFSTYDLVWGKVKSHPWWPGQIFHSSDASQRAMKYQKKDSFLVAYFGDQTFAWNEASSLKPFQTHFSQMERQSSSESFRTAVDFALEEVSRRVELGMVCSCTPKEVCAKIKSQIVENAGIREEVRRRYVMDKSLNISSFEPDKLVHSIRALALFPCGGSDRLELAIAQAQLVAFYRSKGYFRLPGFHVYGGLVENDMVSSLSGDVQHPEELVEHETPVFQNGEEVSSGKARRYSSTRKSKYVSDKGVHPSRKERSLSELMDEKKASLHLPNGYKCSTDDKASSKSALSSGKKRKSVESFSDDTEVKSRKHILSPSRDADSESPAPQSFKIGDCIRRVAPSILKCSARTAAKVDRSSEKPDVVGDTPYTPDGSHRRGFVLPKDYSSPDESLSQLCLAARDPRKRYNFLSKIIDFFTGFRNSVCLENPTPEKLKRFEKLSGGRTVHGIRKPAKIEINSGKTFDFEDMSDSYWTDRVIQSSPEEQPSRRNRKSGGESLFETPVDMAIPSVEAEDYLLSDPALDLENQNLDDNLDLEKERPGRQRRKRKAPVVLPMDEDATLGTKKPSLGGGNYLEKGSFNENNYVDEFCPTALILSFTEADSVPSAMKLNRIFSRFGPLKESQTEVLGETNSARVVFKKRTDAEVALSSAEKFSIFGPTHVNYQLNYLSSSTCRAYSDRTTQAEKDASTVEGNPS